MRLFLRILCVTFLGCFSLSNTIAQTCPIGYTATSLNWDYLDYLTYTGNYTSSNGYLSSNSLAKTQNFAFGTQRLAITHDYGDAFSMGENGLHTGDNSSYGTGDDIQFIHNGSITFTFENPIHNLKFSIYDIDLNQKVTITAFNGITAIPVTSLARVTGTLLTINGSGTVLASATAGNSYIDNTSSDGTIKVDITGPVTRFVVTVTNSLLLTEKIQGKQVTHEDGSFWISDILACSGGSFSTNYYQTSKPFIGQPGYVLHSFDKSVYALDPATGITKLLFTDNTDMGNRTFINSMAYDPIKRILYYVYSLTSSPGSNRILKKYDFNDEKIYTVLSDISSTSYGTGVGIPVVTHTGGNPALGAGVESGAAAFYDGSLYLGIETGDKEIQNNVATSAGTSNREAVIWKIDFDISNIPYRASQTFAMPIDNGAGNLLHDWSDFVINNGLLYDFDGAGSTTQTDVYQYNLITGQAVNYPKPSGWTPGQPSVDWNGVVYNLHAATTSPSINPYIAVYNNNGTIGTRVNITASPMYSPAVPSLGDAAEAFRPKADFGDAPATYDPVSLSPALHEKDVNLKLGTNYEIEWDKISTSNSDGDDDGLKFVRILNTGVGSYQIDALVYNNTGKVAIVGAWIDFNGNGQFDSNEGITKEVGSNSEVQEVSLFWEKVSANLPANSHTYLRLRITSKSDLKLMTTADATGYFANGEVEDWYVPVNVSVLPIQLISFSAKHLESTKVKINWSVAEEKVGTLYELQRSKDGINWDNIYIEQATENKQSETYSYNEVSAFHPNSYYRLKYTEGGVSKYSQIQKVVVNENNNIHVYPNPAINYANLSLQSFKEETAQFFISDVNGKIVLTKTLRLMKGSNKLNLSVKHLNTGIYYIQVYMADKLYVHKLVIRK